MKPAVGLSRVQYSELNARQKESYNFQKVSAVLADYGYCTIRLSDDWSGADFIAQHIAGTFKKVQLKGRLSFDKKYFDKDLWIAFPNEGGWYLYPHDSLFRDVVGSMPNLENTECWKNAGIYNFPSLNDGLRALLRIYRIE